MKLAFAIVTSLVLLEACSSEADRYEPCDRSGGTTDVCVAGTVCGRPSSKATVLTCIPICDDKEQCRKDEDCNGVDGTSVKACRVKD